MDIGTNAPYDHLPTFLANIANQYLRHARAVQTVREPRNVLSLDSPIFCAVRIQEAYQKEFTTFKPDKKLVWMSHLGTVSLDIELDDRTVSAEVTPVEAALIELFSQKGPYSLSAICRISTFSVVDEWTIQELVATIGSIERPTAVKALATWAELGVIKEDSPSIFRLLNIAEEEEMPSRPAQRQPGLFIRRLNQIAV